MLITIVSFLFTEEQCDGKQCTPKNFCKKYNYKGTVDKDGNPIKVDGS